MSIWKSSRHLLLRCLVLLRLLRHAGAADSCTHNVQLEFSDMKGQIYGVGGSPLLLKDGKKIYRQCAFSIYPNRRLTKIKFHVDEDYTHFDSLDHVSFYAEGFHMVGKFSALKPISAELELKNSRQAILLLQSTSNKTRLGLRYECVASGEVEIFGNHYTVEMVAGLSVMLAVLSFFVCGVLPGYYCWYQRMIRRQRSTISLSLVLNARDLRQKQAQSLELEKKVLAELEALPVQSFHDCEDNAAAEEDSCCLCLEDYNADDELRLLPCTHYFHKDCIDKWFREGRFKPRTCPMCRKNPVKTEHSAPEAEGSGSTATAPAASSGAQASSSSGHAAAPASATSASSESGAAASAGADGEPQSLVVGKPAQEFQTDTSKDGAYTSKGEEASEGTKAQQV